MPKCTLYLADPDYVIYQDLKGRGENPSAIFTKALKQRAQDLDKRTAEMELVSIFEGYESQYEEHEKKLDLFKFVGKRLVAVKTKFDHKENDGIMQIDQALYLTKKGSHLLYQVIHDIHRLKYEYKIIEKNKTLPPGFIASEILTELGVQDEIGTFLDI